MGISATSARGGRLELRLSAIGESGVADYVVLAPAEATVGALAAALARELGGPEQRSLWCERRGQALRAEDPLTEAGIRWGDRLALVPPVGEPTRLGEGVQIELVVTGGPCAGERFELPEGAFRVGREPGLEVLLADPSLSRHHLDLVVEGETVTATDAGSSNGTAVNGRAVAPGRPFRVGDRDELELGRTLLKARPLRARAEERASVRAGRLNFNRPPRVNPRPETFHGSLGAPPTRSGKARLPLAASLFPLAAGLILFLLLKSPVMLALAGLTPLMALGTYVSDRRGGARSFTRESAAFRARLATVLAELDSALQEEGLRRRAEAPDADVLLSRLTEVSPALWERRPLDPDFMRLRLGVADLPAQSRVELESGGEEELRGAVESQLRDRETITSVPLTVDLREAGVTGLAGPRDGTASLARWLLLQAAILHSPGELVVLAAVDGEEGQEWDWLKWLPHVRPDRVSLHAPGVSVGNEQTEDLLIELRELITQRRSHARPNADAASAPLQVLVLVDERTHVSRSLLTATLSEASEHGVSFLWLGTNVRDLPGQTGAIVELERGRSVLSLTDVASGAVQADASAEGFPVELAERTARALAPMRDVGELVRAGDIPSSVGLLELLDLLPPTASELERRWRGARGELRATVGMGSEGALVLDLRNEGPHALIAGTTGSGKSELLRTFVAAAATAAPPDRLSFLLVDYKGGAAFAPCASLPHVLEIVSDLDEHLAERALISLNAELTRRERILAEHAAKDLHELIRREPQAAPPLLVIAVDEFAKLREEVPDFVDGVVDIAQRGRSLGVHMVLAAQTLRNAFTPAIRANTNLRLALRVAEETESEDMIASPLAARIPSGELFRGRAYARTGHGELREFQAAYVSGCTGLDDVGELTIERFGASAEASSERRSGEAERDTESDLVALGTAAREATELMGLARPPSPWLPVLPEQLDFRRVDRSGLEPASAAIGLVDLPRLQRQDPLVLDLPDVGNVVAFGAGNSGKTTFLTSAALALALTASPEELCIYGLDAASGGLKGLIELPHCGGVVTADEEERVHRLLRMLLSRVERRREAGAPGQARTGLGRLVLLLDDFGSFTHQYDRPGADSASDWLQRILAGGRAAGVHVILTASRRGAVPPALSAHIGRRLVLRMPTEEDMLALGVSPKAARGARLSPGSGFTEQGNEFHLAIPMLDGQPLDVADAARGIPGERSAQNRPIEVLPDRISREDLPARAGHNRAVVVGIGDDELEPAIVDLRDMHMLVVGPYRSGRSTALGALAQGLAETGASLHLMAPRRSPLRDLGLWAASATTQEQCTALAESLARRLQEDSFAADPAYLLIDDGGELTDARLVTLLEQVVRTARDSSLRVIAAVESGSARGIGNAWIRELRREGHGLLLQPDLAADGDLLAARLPRRVVTQIGPGRGFLIMRGSAELIQVAT